jgi:hypothetical protein
MIERSKPVKLVMINSGKFGYGEVDLSSPLHLVGQNNVGKTTLISTLQFLYIDNQNQMSFSRSMDETRKYYFPGTDSYILFECLTPGGYMVFGVRGLGVLKRSEFQRFIYSGTYNKDDFIDLNTGSIKPFSEIAGELSSRSYTSLKPNELRDSLTGTGRHSVPMLEIVPVKNRSDYDKFRKIFRNLLHLSHLSQEELKKFIIDVNRGELNRIEIDLAMEFKEGYRKVQKNARSLADLKAHSETALKVLDLNSSRKLLLKEIPPLYSAAAFAVSRERADLRRKVSLLSEQLETVSLEKHEAEEYRKTLSQELGGYLRRTGALESLLTGHRVLGESLSDYLEEFEESRIEDIRSQVTEIDVLLRDATAGNPERIRRNINDFQKEHMRLSIQLENTDNLAVSALPGLSQNAVSSLRLFNQDILILPAGSDGIEIKEADSFLNRLGKLGEAIQGNRYEDDSVLINMSSLHKPDLNALSDKRAIAGRISDLNSLIERERSVLKSIEERQQLESRRKELLKELKTREGRNHDWHRYTANTDTAREWEKELTDIAQAAEHLSGKQQETEQRLNRLGNKEKALERSISAETAGLTGLERRAALLPDPEPEWVVGNHLESELGAFELIDMFIKKYSERNRLSQRIGDYLSSLETATYEEYRASEEEATLKKLQEDIDAMEEKEEALRSLWSGLASDVSQAMKSLMASLDVLKRRVSQLNNRLAKVSVSDLKQLKLVLTENTQWTGKVRTGIEADELPLFSDRSEVEKALQSLGSMLETAGAGRIELKDMFNLSFEILDVNDRIRKFQRLENIESNGTTITIKILVNLILLRDLLPENKAQIPFYLDEASSLDRDNLASVVDTAFDMGFPAVLASPEAMDVASSVYFMKDTGGRVFLDPEMSRVRVNRRQEKNSS